MIKSIRRYINKAYKKSLELHGDFEINDEKSIIFVSFHKCATSFFSREVLGSLKAHKHIDYLGKMYINGLSYHPIIIKHNFVYGVIRIQDKNHPRYKFVNNLLSQRNFNKIKQVYWVRDPRDILVSMYYSFGSTHGYSPDESFRAYQKKTRNEINKFTLDEYVLQEAENVRNKFNEMIMLINRSKDYKVFKYENMVLNFDEFYTEISDYLTIDDSFYSQFLNETRPNESEKLESHKRSGSVGAYQLKLKATTVRELNQTLSFELNYFGYKKKVNL